MAARLQLRKIKYLPGWRRRPGHTIPKTTRPTQGTGCVDDNTSAIQRAGKWRANGVKRAINRPVPGPTPAHTSNSSHMIVQKHSVLPGVLRLAFLFPLRGFLPFRYLMLGITKYQRTREVMGPRGCGPPRSAACFLVLSEAPKLDHEWWWPPGAGPSLRQGPEGPGWRRRPQPPRRCRKPCTPPCPDATLGYWRGGGHKRATGGVW
jgi:hypothetical protein